MIVVPVSVCPPPPPLSPYNRTCPNILHTNRKVFSWSPRTPSTRQSPWTRNSCRPPKCLSVPVPCTPPNLPIPWPCFVLGSGSTLNGHVANCRGYCGCISAPRERTWDQYYLYSMPLPDFSSLHILVFFNCVTYSLVIPKSFSVSC